LSAPVETGKPFLEVRLTDNAEALAQRCYEQLCAIWNEGEVHDAFKAVLSRSQQGRPKRAGLQPSEVWMLRLYDQWLEGPAGHFSGGKPSKLNFVRWFFEIDGGQSVEAVRKQLDRLLKARDRIL
jgi:hypothetical protein